MPSLYNGKSKGRSGIKGAMKRVVKPPLYRAWFGARAPVAPSKKYTRYSKKWRKFEQVVTLIKRQHEPGISEGERTASANLVTSLCQRFNVDFEEASQEVEFRKNKYNGGKSVVIIKHRDKFKQTAVRQQTFLVDLCDAIEMMYDCRAYTHREKGTLRVVFYGVASNTISAQMAFKIAYNTATEMGQVFPGNGPRNSYLLGIAAGLWDKATYRKMTFESEIAKAREMAATTFSNEDFTIDENYQADFDFDIGLLQETPNTAGNDQVKVEEDENSNGITMKKPIKKTPKVEESDDSNSDSEDEDEDGDENESDDEDSEDNADEDEDSDDDDDDNDPRNWIQNMLVLADHRTKVEKAAETWLAEQGIKLRAQKKGKKIIRAPHRFEEGKDDSNHIDFGEKRICAALKKDIKLRGKAKARGEEGHLSDSG